MRFGTGAVIPAGATVWSATLNLYVRDYVGTGTVVAEYYPGSNWPIDLSDWTNTPANDAHAGTGLGALVRNQYNAFALQNLGSIATTDSTGFRLHLAEDTAPTSESSVTWTARDASSNPPLLEVCF